MTYKQGDWYIYCDVCGRKILASTSTKLSQYTGKGGLIVCNHDVDEIDAGLVPYIPRRETNVKEIRINHTDTNNAAPIVNLEDMTLVYYLASSQDGYRILSSQDDVPITSPTPL